MIDWEPREREQGVLCTADSQVLESKDHSEKLVDGYTWDLGELSTQWDGNLNHDHATRKVLKDNDTRTFLDRHKSSVPTVVASTGMSTDGSGKEMAKLEEAVPNCKYPLAQLMTNHGLD